MLIDTHSHIDLENFEDHFDKVIETAKEYGVEKIVIPGVSPVGFERIIDLCEKYENVYIVAHSMGTFFAMEAANAHPDKVKGIILLQTPLKIGVKPSAAINTFKSFFNIFGGMYR